MPRFVLVLAVLVNAIAAATAGPSIRSYDVALTLDPARGALEADVTLELVAPPGGLREVELLLNEGFALKAASAAPALKAARFDRERASSFRYAPTSAPLVLAFAKPLAPGGRARVRLRYAGVLVPDPWGTNMITPEWTELGVYGAWYPVLPGTGPFRTRVAVTLDPAFALTGTGWPQRAGLGRWTARDDGATDLVVIAGPGLAMHGDGRVRVAGVALPAATVARLVPDLEAMLARLERKLGPPSGQGLAVVFGRRTRGGAYARPGLVSSTGLPADDRYPALLHHLAHEMAHLWWRHAPATTWEDWLNESFAEYTAMADVRDRQGADAFAREVAAHRERGRGVAIRGLDRDDERADAALYSHGPVLLADLEAAIGAERFAALLRETAGRHVAGTADFLALVEKAAGAGARERLERGLNGTE